MKGRPALARAVFLGLLATLTPVPLSAGDGSVVVRPGAADRDGPPGRSLAPTAATAPGQSMTIDIRGAVAHVAVTRVLSCGAPRKGGSGSWQGAASRGGGEGASAEVVLDIALPPRAALLQVELAAAGGQGLRARPLQVMAPARARDGYLEALRGLGVTPSQVAFDDEARLRVRAICPGISPKQNLMLKYDYSVLLDLSNGVSRLIFPPAAELSPPATHVDVRVVWPYEVAEISIGGAAHRQMAGAAPRATETVSARSTWNVTVVPRGATPDGTEGPRLTTLASFAATGGAPASSAARTLVAYAVGARLGPRQSLPERVLFLVDRSRSVGAGGLEVERDAARKLLEAMPPSTRFDVLFFDRAQKVLFPVPRAATREAIAALDDEMVPAQMANGTDLVAALRQAGELIRRSPADFGPRCLLVLLTDGAVGVASKETNLGAALGPLPGIELMAAALSVRANDDAAVSTAERRALRSVTSSVPLGGVERQVRAADLGDALPALLETLRGGGDLYGIAIRAGENGQRETASGKGEGGRSGKATDTARDTARRSPATATGIVEVLEPSAGESGVVVLGAPPGVVGRNSAITYRGLARSLPLRPVPVDPRWLQPLLAPAAGAGRLLVAPGLVALAEPVIRPSPGPAAGEAQPSGYMERSVVRDALSLAFTPRARACYLSRTAPTPADRDLTGRVRVALDLVRGEVADVRVDMSTLAHPGIESCLREAAYAIEVPRAYRNDEPVTAVLNLVFRPRTRGNTEKPSLSPEIDLMIDAALKDKDSLLPDRHPDAGADAP